MPKDGRAHCNDMISNCFTQCFFILSFPFVFCIRNEMKTKTWDCGYLMTDLG